MGLDEYILSDLDRLVLQLTNELYMIMKLLRSTFTNEYHKNTHRIQS